MGLLKKIGAALRGRQHDTMQAVVDHESIRILEQELRDCQRSVALAKQDVCRVVAERKACERELAQLGEQTQKAEERALLALDAYDVTQAESQALQIADLEQASAMQQDHRRQMLGMEEKLRENLLLADRNIKQYMRELRLARASDNVQRGVSRSNSRGSKLSEQLQEVQGSLSRIRERRLQSDDMANAASEVEQMLGTELKTTLKSQANEVLARLRQQQIAAKT